MKYLFSLRILDSNTRATTGLESGFYLDAKEMSTSESMYFLLTTIVISYRFWEKPMNKPFQSKKLTCLIIVTMPHILVKPRFRMRFLCQNGLSFRKPTACFLKKQTRDFSQLWSQVQALKKMLKVSMGSFWD